MDKTKLNYYQRYYFANEKSVPFHVKDNGYILYIKPVTVEMYEFYKDNVGILYIDKNKISDAKIISMSYLQYLIEVVFVQNQQLQQSLKTILDISLQGDYQYTIGHNEKGRVYLGIRDEDGNLLCRVTPKEFDKIVEIISYYNDMDYDNRYISDDLRKAMESYYELKYKDKHIPTLEEKKAFVSFKSGLTLNELNEMSYRYFNIVYNHAISNDLFFSQKIIQASEKYKVNDNDAVYPLFKKKETKFDFLQDAGAFENKVSQASRGY